MTAKDPELVVELVRAARAWRDTLIPNTSSGLAMQTRVLREAIEAIDACVHDRQWLVTYPDREVCAKCGQTVSYGARGSWPEDTGYVE